MILGDEAQDSGRLGIGMDWNNQVEMKVQKRVQDLFRVIRADNKALIL